MNADTIIQCLGLILLPFIAYLFNRIGKIKDDLDIHKLDVANNYAKKDDLKNALDKIEAVLEKIFDRINRIAERRDHERRPDETGN